MSKHVGNLYRYRQICRTANFRYLDALSVQDSPRPSQKELQNLVKPLKYGKKKIGDFNPAKKQTLLFSLKSCAQNILSEDLLMQISVEPYSKKYPVSNVDIQPV